MMNKFAFTTITRDLASDIKEKISKIRIFNFSDGALNLSLSQSEKNNNSSKEKSLNNKKILGAFKLSWIRIYDINDKYYDFISSDIFLIKNDEGIVLWCSEDTEYISLEYIAKLIHKYVDSESSKSFTTNQFLNKYYNLIGKEIRVANKKLLQLYSTMNQISTSRLKLEDTYEYAKNKLVKKYLLDLISRKIIKENRDKIIDLI